MADKTPDTIRIIKVKGVAEITGESVRTVWRRVREDASFPRPIKLGAQSTGWDVREVIAWLEGKKAQRAAA